MKSFLKTTREVFDVTSALTGIILIVLDYQILNLNTINPILMLTGHVKNVLKTSAKNVMQVFFTKQILSAVSATTPSTFPA